MSCMGHGLIDLGFDCTPLPSRVVQHDGYHIPTPALSDLQLPGSTLILLLIYPPGFSFESSTPCTFMQPSSHSLLYSLSLLPSLYLMLLVRDLPIYILNLCPHSLYSTHRSCLWPPSCITCELMPPHLSALSPKPPSGLAPPHSKMR